MAASLKRTLANRTGKATPDWVKDKKSSPGVLKHLPRNLRASCHAFWGKVNLPWAIDKPWNDS